MNSGKYGSVVKEEEIFPGLKEVYFAFDKPSFDKDELNGKLEEILNNINFNGEYIKFTTTRSNSLYFAEVKFEKSYPYSIDTKFTVYGNNGAKTSDKKLEMFGTVNVVILPYQNYLKDLESGKIMFGTEKCLNFDYQNF